MRMKTIILEFEIVIAETEYIVDIGIEDHFRQRIGHAMQLFVGLLEMVRIEVGVAKCMHKFSCLEPGYLCDHLGQQRIGRDVKRHAQKDVGAALIQLARQTALGDVKLKQAMAWR